MPIFESFFLGKVVKRGVKLNGIKEVLVVFELVVLKVFGVKYPVSPVGIGPTGSSDIDHGSELAQ